MKKFLASNLGILPIEGWLIGIFIIIQPLITGNSVYFLVLAALFVMIFIVSKNLLETTWLTFLVSLVFSRGKYFDLLVLPASTWGGEFDLTLNAAILFSDVLLAIAVYLILRRFKSLKRSFKVSSSQGKMFALLFLFMVISFFSSYVSFFPLTSFYYFIQLSKFIIIYFVGRIIMSDEKTAQKSFKIFIIFLFLNSLLVIVQYFNRGPVGLSIEGVSRGYGVYGAYATENPGLFRAGGFSPDPNATATLIAIAFPILLTSALISGKSYLKVKWFVLFVLIFSLILTASRTLWIVTFLSSLATFYYLRNKFIITLPPYIKKSSIIFVVIVSLLLWPILFQRLATIVGIFGSEGGGTYRLEHIKVSLFYLKKYVLGTGLGTFNYSMAIDFSPDETGLIPTQAHNIFAQLGAETGVLGLILFSLFLLFLLKKKFHASLRNPKNFSIFLAISSYLLSAFFFPWLLHPLVGIVFWIIIAYPLKRS
jgi:hypothetical protein